MFVFDGFEASQESTQRARGKRRVTTITFVVTLGPFDGVSRAADLDLTAHADELVVAGAALAETIRVALERPVDPTRVKAKWKKLDRTLRVELKAK